MPKKGKNRGHRAPGYEGCPGCVDVRLNGKKCAPGKLTQCTAVQARQAGWVPGNCLGCYIVQHKNRKCRSGDARKCPVGWMRHAGPKGTPAPPID